MKKNQYFIFLLCFFLIFLSLIGLSIAKPSYVGISEDQDYVWIVEFDEDVYEDYYEETNDTSVPDYEDIKGIRIHIDEIKNEGDIDTYYQGELMGTYRGVYVEGTYYETEDNLNQTDIWGNREEIDWEEEDDDYETIIYEYNSEIYGIIAYFGSVFIDTDVDWGEVEDEVESYSTIYEIIEAEERNNGIKVEIYNTNLSMSFTMTSDYNINGVLSYFELEVDDDLLFSNELIVEEESLIDLIWIIMVVLLIATLFGILLYVFKQKPKEIIFDKELEIKEALQIRTLTGHNKKINSILVSPTGRYIISGSSDGIIKLWDLPTGTHLRTQNIVKGVNSMAISPNEDYLILGTKRSTLELYQIPTMEKISLYENLKSNARSVVFSPNGKYLIANSSQTSIKVWDFSSKNIMYTFTYNLGVINSLAVSSDNRYLISGSTDNTIKIWTLETGQLLNTLRSYNLLQSLAISPNGKYIISTSGASINLWELSTARRIWSYKKHSKNVHYVTFSPNGDFIISGSGDNTVRIWDVKTGKILKTLQGHTGSVYSVTVSPDGNYIISGSQDKTIKVWNLLAIKTAWEKAPKESRIPSEVPSRLEAGRLKNFCPTCGNEYLIGDIYCRECGTKF